MKTPIYLTEPDHEFIKKAIRASFDKMDEFDEMVGNVSRLIAMAERLGYVELADEMKSDSIVKK